MEDVLLLGQDTISAAADPRTSMFRIAVSTGKKVDLKPL